MNSELENRQTLARVLVIDDSPAIREDFRKILERSGRASTGIDAVAAELFGGEAAPVAGTEFEVEFASQGRDGLEMVRAALAEGRPFALAFVDGRMPPGWDGVETIDRIWRECPNLQAVLCTAYSDYSWDDVVRRLGFSDRLVILKKPFENVEALQLATALTEKWRLSAQSRARVSDLEAIVKQRTEELRRSEERFRLIAENAGDLIGVVDAAGHLTYNSPSFVHLLGYPAHELASRSFFELVDEPDRSKVVEAIRTSIEQGRATSCEFRIRTSDGKWLLFDSHNGPFRRNGGAVKHALFVARDVSERRRIEVQLRQAQKLESIGQLAAGVAHELNTPIQFVGDNVRFLREAFEGMQEVIESCDRWLETADHGGDLAAAVEAIRNAQEVNDAGFLMSEIPRAISQTLDGVERVTRIVRAMKEFSHPGSPNRELVDLNKAIETTVTVSRNEWKYVAEVVTDLAPDLPAVPAIAGELNQVLLNLIINAAHAIAEKSGRDADRLNGRISISTRDVDGCAEIRVADTGGGIPEQVSDRIFEPFFTTKPVGRGTGQGLAIARSVVVDHHGGELTFESEPGKGATFIIRLPLAVPAPEAKPQEVSP